MNSTKQSQFAIAEVLYIDHRFVLKPYASDQENNMQRMGLVIGIVPERIKEYTDLHANTWPEIHALLSEANIRNYSIFLREPENLLFAYWEYHGEDFDADMQVVSEQNVMKRWWTLCSPCQIPLESREKGEHWAMMQQVFYHD